MAKMGGSKARVTGVVWVSPSPGTEEHVPLQAALVHAKRPDALQ
jgi:hypothetical protein